MLGWMRLFARSRVERTWLLAPDEFEAMLTRELSRASRANSCFSLLTLSLSATELQTADIRVINEFFRARRRATDLAGQTQNGRIGISLPDTNQAQAEVFAQALHETLEPRGVAFTHTIDVYPDACTTTDIAAVRA